MKEPHKNVVGNPELLLREQKTRADEAGWKSGACGEDGEERSDSDGGNGVLIYTLLFQESPLQHWDKSRTNTSILTTSSLFWLKSWARKVPQSSLYDRISMQVTWRDLALLQQAIFLPWCSFPQGQVGKGFQRGYRRRSEWVLVHATMKGFRSPLLQNGLKPPSISAPRGRNTAPDPLQWLCSASPCPSGCVGTQAVVCMGLSSWEAASVASDMTR